MFLQRHVPGVTCASRGPCIGIHEDSVPACLPFESGRQGVYVPLLWAVKASLRLESDLKTDSFFEQKLRCCKND